MAIVCLVCTLIAVLPSCLHLLFNARKTTFVLSLINTSLAFFLFSFQVRRQSHALIAIEWIPNEILSFLGARENHSAGDDSNHFTLSARTVDVFVVFTNCHIQYAAIARCRQISAGLRWHQPHLPAVDSISFGRNIGERFR